MFDMTKLLRTKKYLACLASALMLPLAQARMPFPLFEEFVHPLDSTETSQSSIVQTEVLRVLDGDTIAVKAFANNVRIASIDAPETGSKNRPAQPFSQASKSTLQRLLGAPPRNVELRCYEEDRYGRHICDVFVQKMNVGQEMVAMGMAWANTSSSGRYLRSPQYLMLQHQAQREKKGLWSEANKPVEPWVWRKRCWQQSDC